MYYSSMGPGAPGNFEGMQRATLGADMVGLNVNTGGQDANLLGKLECATQCWTCVHHTAFDLIIAHAHIKAHPYFVKFLIIL